VQPLVRGQVDPLDRLARALQQRLVQPARLPGEREDAAVVVRVAVDVEQARAAGDEGGADGVERLAVAALRDVGDGEQQLVGLPATTRPRSAGADHRHASSSTLDMREVFLRVCVLAWRRRRPVSRTPRHEKTH
jgi:hypothetical protein